MFSITMAVGVCSETDRRIVKLLVNLFSKHHITNIYIICGIICRCVYLRTIGNRSWDLVNNLHLLER